MDSQLNTRSATTEDAHSRTRKEWSEWAYTCTPALPNWLRFDYLEDFDSARILKFHRVFFLRVSGMAYIADENGLWQELQPRSPKVESFIRRMILDSRQTAARDMSEDMVGEFAIGKPIDEKMGYASYLAVGMNLTANHCSNVGQQLRQVILSDHDIQTVPIENFDKRNVHPVMPLADGGSVDLTTGRTMGAIDTADLWLHNYEWALPMLDPAVMRGESEGAQAMRECIRDRFGQTLMSRIARHALGISKNIDVIVAPTDWGKGTLIELLSKAFPGMVGRLDQVKAFGIQGDRFSQVQEQLAKKCWVFIDEAGEKSNIKIRSSSLKTFIDDVQQVELKFEKNRPLPRLGTVIMVGHDWPDIDTAAQGMETRFKWALSIDPAAEPMTVRQRHLLLTEDAVRYFRQAIVRRAVQLWQEDDLDKATSTGETWLAIEEFFNARSNSIAAALREAFEIGDPIQDYVRSAEVQAAIEPAAKDAGEKVTGNLIKNSIAIAFHSPSIVAKSKRIDGPVVRVWVGIKKIST